MAVKLYSIYFLMLPIDYHSNYIVALEIRHHLLIKKKLGGIEILKKVMKNIYQSAILKAQVTFPSFSINAQDHQVINYGLCQTW